MKVRFGVTWLAREFDSFLDWVRECDRIGFEMIGIGDSQSLWLDLHVTLALIAANTRRMRLGPTVTNPLTRHPAVAAGAIASIQKLSGGRAFFGLGGGDSAVLNIGERPAGREEVLAYGQAVRALTAGETVTYRGKELRLRWESQRVPLYLAAEGPKMLHAAGRVADGVILSSGISADVVRDTLGRIRAGAEEAGRDSNEIDIWWMVKLAFAPTEAAGIEVLKFSLAGTANHVFRHTLEGKLVPPEHRDGLLALQREYASRHHANLEQGAANAALADKYGLTGWLGERFAIAGPPEHGGARIRPVGEAGATHLLS